MRRASTLLIGIVLAAAVVAGGWWAFHGRPAPRPMPFPSDDEVESVSAAVDDIDGSGSIPEFTLGAEFVPAILRAFRPAESTDYAFGWEGAAYVRLRVRTTAGATHHIDVPFSGKNCLFFTLDGVRCARAGPYEPVFVGEREIDRSWASECSELAGALREMQRAQSGQGRGCWLTEHLNNLERSAGRRPPRTEPYR